MRVAYVFFNGELLGSKEYYLNLMKKNKGDIYCADGGANLLEKLGVVPMEIWGDFDSVPENILEKYEKSGVIIKRFPKDKDFTDGELILKYISEKKYDKIIVIGGLGGRKDHELTNLNLMFKFKNLIFVSETEDIFAIENYTLKGFKYPLTNYTLHQGESICMSNIAQEDICVVSFDKGKLIGIVIK